MIATIFFFFVTPLFAYVVGTVPLSVKDANGAVTWPMAFMVVGIAFAVVCFAGVMFYFITKD